MLKPIIILAQPQLDENVGAIARIMANFGFEELRLVNPIANWISEKAIATSCNGSYVLQNAVKFDSINQAIADIQYIYATSIRQRYMHKECISSADISNHVKKNAQSAKIGIMFGRESSGLSNDELSLANAVCYIETNESCKSLNIAQAVCVLCYELSNISTIVQSQDQELCTHDDLNLFLTDLFDKLEARDFFATKEKISHMQRNIRNIFTRIHNLSKHEVKTLRGIVKHLTFSIRR